MRVISGQWKGFKLDGGQSKETRPLTDRIKESIFGILGEQIVDAEVLDLFAGSGSFGIEALSRGANSVIFCEKSKTATNIIRKNLIKTKCNLDNFNIFNSDVSKALAYFSEQQTNFDVIFVDPPFKTPIGKEFLSSLSDYDILNKDGILIYRYYKKESVPEQEGIFNLTRQKSYGDSVVKLYQRVDL